MKHSFLDKEIKVFNNKVTVCKLNVALYEPPSILRMSLHGLLLEYSKSSPHVKVITPKTRGHMHDYIQVEITHNSVCNSEDTFDRVIGERIAESRAKKALYKMLTYLDSEFMKELLRTEKRFDSEYGKSLRLYGTEMHHLEELLN